MKLKIASGLLLLAPFLAHTALQDKAAAPVTVFLVRHAETEDNAARTLDEAGRRRAQALLGVLRDAGVTHVFSSDYPRTRGTVAPLATAAGLKIELVSPRRAAAQAARLRALPPGSVAVVAGHSNTLPQLTQEFGVRMKGLRRRLMSDTSHDQLHVLTIPQGGKATLVRLYYGGASQQGGGGHGGAPAVDPDEVLIGAAKNDRQSRSIFFYKKKDGFEVFGQFELTFGSPKWKAEYTKVIENAPLGSRLRFGNNFFATFDTSCAVDVGGQTLAPGLYYLVFERGKGDAVHLLFLDPKPIRAQKLTSGRPGATKGGVRLTMQHKAVDTAVEALTVELGSKRRKGDTVELAIAFGTHRITGKLRAKF